MANTTKVRIECDVIFPNGNYKKEIYDVDHGSVPAIDKSRLEEAESIARSKYPKDDIKVRDIKIYLDDIQL